MTFDPSQQQSQPPFQPQGSNHPASGSPANVPAFIPPSVVLSPKKASGGRVATGTIVLVLAGFVAAAGVGFAGGRATAPQPTGRQFGGNGGFPNASFAAGAGGGNGGFGGLTGGTVVSGAVTALGNGTITIQESNGRSVTITIPSTATYHGQTTASATDVTVGTNVQVTVNRPSFRGGGAEASGGPAASPGANLSLTATDVTLLAK